MVMMQRLRMRQRVWMVAGLDCEDDGIFGTWSSAPCDGEDHTSRSPIHPLKVQKSGNQQPPFRGFRIFLQRRDQLVRFGLCLGLHSPSLLRRSLVGAWCLAPIAPPVLAQIYVVAGGHRTEPQVPDCPFPHAAAWPSSWQAMRPQEWLVQLTRGACSRVSRLCPALAEFWGIPALKGVA